MMSPTRLRNEIDVLLVLHVPDCPNLQPLVAGLAEATTVPVRTREIATAADAVEAGMVGSPTLLIAGRDPFAAPDISREASLSCRIYRDDRGRIIPTPSVTQLRAALADAGLPTTSETPETPPVTGPDTDCAGSSAPSRTDDTCCQSDSDPSGWASLAREMPSDPTARTVYRAILRAFAATGHPPTREQLATGTGTDPARVEQVLAELHETDLIRLDPTRQIAVAYPFSNARTHHTVRIHPGSAEPAGQPVRVWAMCAIDALGIAAMLDRPTHIESVDPQSPQQARTVNDR